MNLSENVRRSLEFKRRNGEWSGVAPIGYINIRDNKGKSSIIPDPERAFLIRKLFIEYATGCYSIGGDLKHKADEWGLKNKTKSNTYLSASQIHQIIQNPFYYGEMLVKGKLYPHKYEALITKELFDKCQQIRLGTTRSRHIRYTKTPFVFRGLLECAVSGRRVSCDIKKGKFVYLICRDPKNPEKKLFVPENDVLDQVKDVFKSFNIPQDLLVELTAHLKASHDAEKDFHDSAIKGLQKEYLQINEKLSALLDLRLDKSITKDEYDIKAQSLKQRQHEISIMTANHEKGDDSFKTTVESLFSLASQAYEVFESSKIEEKRQLIGFVFSNLTLRGASIEYTLRNPLNLMVGNRSYQDWLRG